LLRKYGVCRRNQAACLDLHRSSVCSGNTGCAAVVTIFMRWGAPNGGHDGSFGERQSRPATKDRARFGSFGANPVHSGNMSSGSFGDRELGFVRRGANPVRSGNARFVRRGAARIRFVRGMRARLRSGAPFHHLVDSCLRQGRFGSNTFGSTAYLAAKAKGDRSMPSKRGTPEDVYDVAPQDPHDKVKVGLLEPQSPAVYKPTPRYHVCSEDPRDTRFRRTTSEGFHSGERPPDSGGTGRTGHLTRAKTSIKSRRRDRLWGASPRATEPS
jgi:hypothetical protein